MRGREELIIIPMTIKQWLAIHARLAHTLEGMEARERYQGHTASYYIQMAMNAVELEIVEIERKRGR